MDLRAKISTPLELAIGRETIERYESAWMRLSPVDREAVTMRVDLDFTYPQIANALGNLSANAVRMRIIRAILRLAEMIHE